MKASRSGPHVNHLVITVRDIEASHHFYADLLGFEKCAEYHGENYVTPMWFYRGHPETHHDFALVQATKPEDIPASGGWAGFFPETLTGLNHFAIGYGSREEWLDRLKVLQDAGVEFIIRGNHGMTHSAYVADPDGHGVEVLYDLPNEVWEGDVEGALNYFEFMPNEGEASLADPTDYEPFPAKT